MLIALPIVIIMCIYAKDIMAVFANEQYQNAYILLPYFAFSAFFLSFTDYTTYQYHLSKKTYIFVIRFQPISVMKQAGSGFYFLYGVKAYYLSLSEIANSNRGR